MSMIMMMIINKLGKKVTGNLFFENYYQWKNNKWKTASFLSFFFPFFFTFLSTKLIDNDNDDTWIFSCLVLVKEFQKFHLFLYFDFHFHFAAKLAKFFTGYCPDWRENQPTKSLHLVFQKKLNQKDQKKTSKIKNQKWKM